MSNKNAAAAKAAQKKPAGGAFGGLADMLNAGDLGALTAENAQDFSMVVIAEISVKEQVREIFEDEENSLDDLAESIRQHGVFQPIIVRPIPGPVPFELVAGERRLRAAILANQEQIPAMVRELTDEQAEEIQFAENIQRKNLTQIETAKRLQRDLDELGGDVEALMQKRQKSRAWISKWLSMLDLPEQAMRVVTENVSADAEVILAVKQVEKLDPKAAEKLVDELKETRGKKGQNAREKVQAAKDAVKPPKKPRKEKTPPTNPDAVATPKDRSHEEPGPVTTVEPSELEAGTDSMLADIFASAKMDAADQAPGQALDDAQDAAQEPAEEPAEAGGAEQGRAPALAPAEALSNAYGLIFESGSSPKMVLECMKQEERDNCETWLTSFYEAGITAKDVGRAVLQGFRNGQFAQEGPGAFALAAFLYGCDSEAKFSMLNILGSVKA